MIESSFGAEPVVFVIGDGSMDAGLELALTGLRAGDQQVLNLMPGQAFGMPDPEAIGRVPLSAFPSGMAAEAGVFIEFTTPQGKDVAGRVIAVSNDSVDVDFNHPLAGREIVFKVEVLAVDNPGENSES